MSREFDDIRKKIEESNDNLYQDDSEILNEILDIKKEIKNISTKVDLMLDILNNFTILLEEAEDDSWTPEQEESWNSYEDYDEDEEI